MNAWNAAIVQRLTTAGLLQAAERAAKKVELRLADCLAPGDATGGHVAIWKALAKEGQTPAQIAALVGFPEVAVRTEVREVSAPPMSGPMLKKATPPTKPQPDVAELVRVAVAAAVAPLRAELAELRAMLRPLSSRTPDFDPERWLDARGEMGRRIREIVAEHSVTVEAFFSPSRRARLVQARRAAIVYLTEQGLSQPEIGDFLKRDRSTISMAQHLSGVRPAFLIHGRRAAA